ncbi:MAG TPA: flippase [Longimicrobiales bacterium]|nr:flippase [Longimicrobiales bacterium]
MSAQWLSGSAWNLLGITVPFAVALVCMPLLLAGLGPERYGLLLLSWSIVGYFSVFDFGLGRAITQRLAVVDPADRRGRASVVVTGVLALAGLGVAGGTLMALAAPLVERVGSIAPDLRAETVRAVAILGAGLPFVLLSTGLRGALEGVADFGWLNLIRGVAGVGTYAAPVIVMAFAPRVDAVCAGLVAVRGAGCVAYAVRCAAHFDLSRPARLVDRGAARRLATYGGWVTVSSVVSPIMAYLDRFLVAGAISVTLAGYYGTSQEVVTRFQVVPSAVFAALFPFVARHHAHDPSRAGALLVRGAGVVAWTLLPVAAACLLFAREGLTLWLGPDFAAAATEATRILVLGSFVNCLALGPYTLLHAVGRPDVTAKIHLLELPLFLAALAWAVPRLGIVGVALAWSGRMVLDLLVLLWAARRCATGMAAEVRRIATRAILPIALLAGLFAVESAVLASAALVALAAVAARVLLTEWHAGDATAVAPRG